MGEKFPRKSGENCHAYNFLTFITTVWVLHKQKYFLCLLVTKTRKASPKLA